jgi:DNA (cytosine-5)-methyltransferase 1
MVKKYNVISIYSGAGGIDLGFEEAGFNILYSTDYWDIACETLKLNKISKIVECKDIRKINFKEVLSNLGLNNVDCLVGGPPCPPYSKSRFYLKYKKRGIKDDEGAYTLSEFFRVVGEIKPKIFFFENVHGFIFKPHLEAMNYLKKRSKELNYNISWKIVNAADYGIPQTRERFLCVGTKKGLPKFEFPKQTHCKPTKVEPLNDLKPWIPVIKVLRDLDVDSPEDKKMVAGSKHKELLKLVPPGENYLFFTKERGHSDPKFKWRSRYWSFLLKLDPNRPSWTIQASHSNNMGPFHWKNRFLRIAEIKRIQTFKDNYQLTGSYKDQWRQVGNAVPPKLAKIFAEEIKKQILEK